MIGVPSAVTEDGDIYFHVKAGARIPLSFYNEDGSPRDMTGSSVFIETSNGVRAQLEETGDSNVLLLSLAGSDFAELVNRIGEFVVIDEGVTPYEEVWSGKIIVKGWTS